MGIASPQTQHDRDMKAAFDCGWNGALEEAIVILDTADHQGQSVAWAIAALREFYEINLKN